MSHTLDNIDTVAAVAARLHNESDQGARWADALYADSDVQRIALDDAMTTALEGLAIAADAVRSADYLLGRVVLRCRREGLSWAAIGEVTGVSRQAAQNYWAHRIAAMERNDAMRAKIAAERASQRA